MVKIVSRDRLSESTTVYRVDIDSLSTKKSLQELYQQYKDEGDEARQNENL